MTITSAPPTKPGFVAVMDIERRAESVGEVCHLRNASAARAGSRPNPPTLA